MNDVYDAIFCREKRLRDCVVCSLYCKNTEKYLKKQILLPNISHFNILQYLYLHSPAYGQYAQRFLSLVGRSGKAGL